MNQINQSTNQSVNPSISQNKASRAVRGGGGGRGGGGAEGEEESPVKPRHSCEAQPSQSKHLCYSLSLFPSPLCCSLLCLCATLSLSTESPQKPAMWSVIERGRERESDGEEESTCQLAVSRYEGQRQNWRERARSISTWLCNNRAERLALRGGGGSSSSSSSSGSSSGNCSGSSSGSSSGGRRWQRPRRCGQGAGATPVISKGATAVDGELPGAGEVPDTAATASLTGLMASEAACLAL